MVADLILPFTKKCDHYIRRLRRTFEPNFGARGPKFEQIHLQKFKSPGVAREGGMLNLRIDRRINRKEVRSLID